jgi:patatin-like phospholipase/acyl hydrolase
LCPDNKGGGRPRFEARDALNLYVDKGHEIFTRSIWQKMVSLGGVIDEKHSATKIEYYFREYFGETKLSELLKPCLITAYDTERRSAFFFTSANAEDKGRDFLVRDVARSTSAAPTYFEAAGIKSLSGIFYSLIDGGLFANNPAMCAYAESRKMDFDHISRPGAADMLLLSLGTGIIEKQYLYRAVKDWGLIEWIRPVIDIMMSGVSETVHHQLIQIFNSVNMEESYLRIAPDLSNASPEMDEAGSANIEALMEAGGLALDNNLEALDRFAELIIQN